MRYNVGFGRSTHDCLILKSFLELIPFRNDVPGVKGNSLSKLQGWMYFHVHVSVYRDACYVGGGGGGGGMFVCVCVRACVYCTYARSNA